MHESQDWQLRTWRPTGRTEYRFYDYDGKPMRFDICWVEHERDGRTLWAPNMMHPEDPRLDGRHAAGREGEPGP